MQTTALEFSTYPDHPVLAVGAFVFDNGRVLMVRRGRPPAENLWAIPGGKVRLGESLQKSAEREVLEETGLIICAGKPVCAFDLIEHDSDGRIRFHYVIVDLDAELAGGVLRAGDDAREARWVAAEELSFLNVSRTTIDMLRDCFRFGI
ncbi:MAG: NUDIX hydrolase [Desulfobacterales bacterium]|nr:NUDIX hydrolase [Desulfobacterales bacterium]MDD3080774.1 NUDIX hydrolase [Desulfobacterales bacterium]MDD3951286.1 NUDIX hydrolase [Desulfobacterales bacterium]MDD4464283.1 NUDIX hydrolase [Desulfobacterales bacterium]